MRVLVLGGSGMLGSVVFEQLACRGTHEVCATIREDCVRARLSHIPGQLVSGIDARDTETLAKLISEFEPDVVINCIGVVKQLDIADDPIRVLPVNSILPHILKNICGSAHARLIHISTDCVFSGRSGNYRESDISDCEDLYGKSKYIGEVHDAEHVLTIRTSIIGHEIGTSHGLVDWFLAQEESVKGYRKAIFSGLPTTELARVIDQEVLPNNDLWGLYHVSSSPVSKYDLLQQIARTYGKSILIEPTDVPVIDRSLNSDRFLSATGYMAPDWPELIRKMHSHRLQQIEKAYV